MAFFMIATLLRALLFFKERAGLRFMPRHSVGDESASNEGE